MLNIMVPSLLIPYSHAHLAVRQEPQIQINDAIQSLPTWTPPSQTVRQFWMKEALSALTALTSSPCPHEPFGTVIVNHTSPNPSDIGDVICIGANNIGSGNPTLHGEIAAINNCSAVLTDPDGHWKLTPSELSKAWSQFTLYTTAEPCPMCASAIRWAGFRECVYGTSSAMLIKLGWPVIDISAKEVFERSRRLGLKTALLSVGANETDPYLSWQYRDGASCPVGCHGSGRAGRCLPDKE
ncbi:related to TAD2-subunit of tRNA-specific adenosine-34 deaminase [Ramularia collo-cygni]|uniref:Related to TAD2-subunit of tRNA-specific adenosine-34 deaminase n=1 Tax=Ramularia collo-cygni TaxID=112498 RepID=A0A2D3UN18_9PEZI|nr:related to TAD2-subunit of tRNA-specific adenosine-34 deaminase [Ramularia collo-cygni]CZT17182.1 related to TAD2-subunit of tRNA-specific adenosine-34 deaminase [Ramularia collo-cygni]